MTKEELEDCEAIAESLLDLTWCCNTWYYRDVVCETPRNSLC